MVLIICSASIVVLQFRFTARCFLDELAVVGWFALCSSALSSAKLSDFFEAPAFFFFFFEAPQSDLFFVCFVFEAPVSELPDFFGSTLCYQEREVAWFIHPSTHDTGQVTNTGVPSGKLFLLNVQICLFVCWASFEIKGLCLILNKNLVLSYACAHLCCWVCLKWRVYICHWWASFLRMCLWWSLCTLCLLACQVRVTVGDSGLCWWFCVMAFKCQLTPLCVVSVKPHL